MSTLNQHSRGLSLTLAGIVSGIFLFLSIHDEVKRINQDNEIQLINDEIKGIQKETIAILKKQRDEALTKAEKFRVISQRIESDTREKCFDIMFKHARGEDKTPLHLVEADGPRIWEVKFEEIKR